MGDRKIDRKGRGQLSSIDQLPEEANDDIQWAVQELAKRKRSQADILFELNDRLEVIGCGPISSSAFNRYSTRVTNTNRRLKEVSEIGKAVATTLGPDNADNVTVMIVQMIKEQTYRLLENGDLSTKQVMELSRALSAALGAQKTSVQVKSETKDSNAKDAKNKEEFEEAAKTAADGIAQATNRDPAQVLKDIRSAYGIQEAEPEQETFEPEKASE